MSQIEALRQHVMRLYLQHVAAGMIPTSIRFLFYELVALSIIAKQASGVLRPGAKGRRRPDQNLIDAITSLRESGDIPWDAIVDETRSLDDFTGSESIFADALTYMNAFKIDPWTGDAPLVLTESRSLAGVLRALIREHRALIAPTNGQTGGFLHNDVVPRLRDGQRVLYLGDYDLAGNDIENNTRRVLERYHHLQWERLALTRTQVDRYALLIIIKRDKRFNNGGAHEAVETEALSQGLIVETVTNRLDELRPQPLDSVLERERGRA
jgi:hypothetical protein